MGRIIQCWMIWMLAGCLQSELVPCNDTFCPADYTCSPSGCLSPMQRDACEGHESGAACSVSGLGEGICQDGGCLVARCGNGVVEPGEACDDGNREGGDGCNGSCSSDETCGNGLLELDEECDCGTSEHPGTARCEGTYNGDLYCSETCRRRRCGDGVLDPGEVCDDGNNVGGDGCSFDCKSLETCGNGVLDYFAGEQCDDGNMRNLDGCATSCKSEPIDWRQLVQTEVPPARYEHAIAYDAARERVVMFGGAFLNISQNELLGDTWELAGDTWLRRSPATSPSARSGFAMVYDADRHRVVLFGGTNPVGTFDETWEYDGETWTRRTFLTRPPARMGHAMTYDAARRRVVLFGGLSNCVYPCNGNLADTWEYDGVAWTQITTAHSPSPRWGHALAYDARGARVVLYGGGNYDTWKYDGVDWLEITPTAGPITQSEHAMTYDAARERIVYLGHDINYAADTWELAGNTWTHVDGATLPWREKHAMTYDIAHRRVVVFGGSGSVGASNATYTFDGSTWSAITPPASPPSNSQFAATYDSQRGHVVMFGGYANGHELWELDGATWTQRFPATYPMARHAAVMAYDPKRDRIVLFGGEYNGPLGDTWEYDGVTWTLKNTQAGAPIARLGHAMAYDPVRQRVVLFGGTYGGAFAFIKYADTWEWDGDTWTERTVAMSPPPVAGHAMAYDAWRDRMVVWGGGIASNSFLEDVWELDATTWTKRTLAPGPPGRASPGMAFDPLSGRIVMFGGSRGGPLADLWDLDASGWHERVAATPPPARSSPILTYDASGSRIVLFGGSITLGSDLGDTWVLGATNLTVEETCRSDADYDRDGNAGCADDECWGVCRPLCSPGTPAALCPASPRCGDGDCSGVETCRSCPDDCMVNTPACPLTCGDYHCDAGETTATCPGDCP